MNMGNVKRSIQIEEVKDDIFSDDIKTKALIEEIEAAEIAARQANIDRQIETSRPTAAQKIQRILSKKSTNFKKSISERLAELKEKKPNDPRIEKTSLKKKISIKVKKIRQPKNTVTVKMPKIQPVDKPDSKIDNVRLPKIEPVKSVKSHDKQSFASRINALAPQGVAKKTVAEIAVASALLVAGIEIWAWNFSHPLFPNKTKDEISVPITGDTTEIEEDSPFKDQESSNSETITTEEKAETIIPYLVRIL